MDSESITFWKKEGWKNGFFKFVFIVILFFLLIILYSYVSKFKVVYLFGIDILSVLTKLVPILLIFYSFTYKKFMIKEYIKRMGLNITDWKKILVGFLITLLGLFALMTAFYLKNAGLAFSFGLKVNIYQALTKTYTFLILQIVSIVIWEEILFRGYFQNLLEAYFSDKQKRFAGLFAILISSILFTLFHFLSFNGVTFNLRVINLFCGSLIIGYAYYKARNLWVSIFIHGGYNVLQDAVVSIFMIDRINFVSEACYRELMNTYNMSSELSRNITETIRNIMGR